jgi:serine/threonine-protein kinase
VPFFLSVMSRQGDSPCKSESDNGHPRESVSQVEGPVLAGRYQLISQLGQGGMGSVWRAVHKELGTPAAVKLIDPIIASNPEALARFKREAQAAASLRSSNVVQILDYGVDLGTPYIVMELLDGENLAMRLARGGRLSPEATASILSQVGRAVSKAHGAGIVHRDLKPDNIFIVREGEDEIAKVLDFGIAKQTHTRETMTHGVQTQVGTMLGTPYYMSPEQVSGKREVDHRTDVWALAVIAFECLVGRRPFEADMLGALLLAICTEELPVPSKYAAVPAGFDEWFARGTQRNPDLRFQSVREALGALRSVCLGPAAERQSVVEPMLALPASDELGSTCQHAGPTSVTIGFNGVPSRSRFPLYAGMSVFLLSAAVGVILVNLRGQRETVTTDPSATAVAVPAGLEARRTTAAAAVPEVLPATVASAPTPATSALPGAAPLASITGTKSRESARTPSAALLPVALASTAPSARSAPVLRATAPLASAVRVTSAPVPVAPKQPRTAEDALAF